MTDQTPTGHTPIDVEPDAWRDRDGILYLNLRKYPNGLNGAYDPDPSATPVFLAARGGNADNTLRVAVETQDAAGWRQTAKEYEGQIESLAAILAANHIREAADAFRSEVAGDKRPSYITVDVFRVWSWFRDRAATLDAAPAPTEDRWDFDAHPGDCHPRREPDGTWTVCCRECAGTGVFPVPWINSPAEGRADMDRCSDVRCKGTGRVVIGFAAPAPSKACGEKVAGGRCVMPAGHQGGHGQVGLRCAPAPTDTEQYLPEGQAVLNYVRGFTGNRIPLPSPGLLAACIRNSLAAREAHTNTARGGNTDNTLRDLLDSTYEGAVMSNARYGEGFHDGWRVAMDHVRAALDAAPAHTERPDSTGLTGEQRGNE